jgi:hypothetical protein
MTTNLEPQWIQQVKARKLGGVVSVALDALAPLGPLGAQLVYVAQPALGLFIAHDALTELAQSLEEPDGIARLRALLDEDDSL